jgi:hypothetical protein
VPRNPASQRAAPPAGSRTRLESRLAFGGPDEDAEEIATPTRRFSLLEITSGFPDESREEDERREERRARELRTRVKSAPAVSSKPGVANALRHDWQRAAYFNERFRVTEEILRCGVIAIDPEVDTS